VRRPDDECPFRKPFPADFDDCPAFQPRQFIPLNTLFQPLEPVLTCRHLETRALNQPHRWYAACSLGNAESRRQWARQVGVGRLERIRAVQRELGTAIAPYNQRLWALKGQQLRAFNDGKDAEPVTAELRQLASQVSEELGVFLRTHEETFAEIDLPVEAALTIVQLAIGRFIETPLATEVSLEVPDDVLRRFPEPVRAFFRPGVPERPAPGC
jgi:hypothetical protein